MKRLRYFTEPVLEGAIELPEGGTLHCIEDERFTVQVNETKDGRIDYVFLLDRKTGECHDMGLPEGEPR